MRHVSHTIRINDNVLATYFVILYIHFTFSNSYQILAFDEFVFVSNLNYIIMSKLNQNIKTIN